MSLQELESKQKLVLRSCGIQHPYLHLPWAAFEDSGSFCILYAVMDKVRCATKVPAQGCSSVLFCEDHTMAPEHVSSTAAMSDKLP